MTQAPPDGMAPEWPHSISSDEIGNKPQKIRFEADEEQRAALVRRLGIKSLDSAVAELVVKRNSGNMVVHVHGVVKAKMVQDCVVTLEPINTEVEEELEAWFADPDQAVSFAKARQQMLSQKMGEETPILSEEDDPEPIVEGAIDLGELATQFLVMGIDPYPHAEGVHYELGDDNLPEDASDIRKNPFAKLKDWKDNT